MNNYKFRGKKCWLDDDGKKVYGKWVYGYLMGADKICPPNIDLTAPDFFDRIDFVDPETVGQWTGLQDTNGKESKDIYVGDIIRVKHVAGFSIYEVKFGYGYFYLDIPEGRCILGKLLEHSPYEKGVIVEGNIHDNPELLEGK